MQTNLKESRILTERLVKPGKGLGQEQWSAVEG